MTHEVIMRPGELTVQKGQSTLNKEQSIFMPDAGIQTEGVQPVKPAIRAEVSPLPRVTVGLSLEGLTPTQRADALRTARLLEGFGLKPDQVTSKGRTEQKAGQVVENAQLDSEKPEASTKSQEILGKGELTDQDRADLFGLNAGRIAKAEELLKDSLRRELTDKEKEGILRAHFVGAGEKGKNGEESGVFNVTREQLLEKAKILKDAGFDQEQRREIIESGLTAAAPPPPSVSAQRVMAISDFLSATFTGRLAEIQRRIGEAHAVSVFGDPARGIPPNPSGISSDLLRQYFKDYLEGVDRTLGATPPGPEEVQFANSLRKVLMLDELASGAGEQQQEFITAHRHWSSEMEKAYRVNDRAGFHAARLERERVISDFVGEINPSSITLHDEVLKLIIPNEVALRRLAFRIIGNPLLSETSAYSLSFYAGINLDAITNLLKTLSENERLVPDERTRLIRNQQLIDINTLKDGVQFVHELNRNIVGNNLDGASQYADALKAEYQDRLQRLSPAVAAVQRALDSSYSYVLSRDGWINAKNYAEMMGLVRNSKTGQVEIGQDSAVFKDIKHQINMAKKGYVGLVTNDMVEFADMKPWELQMAYSIGRNLFNISHRGAEWISQGNFPPGGAQYESPPGEGFARIMNFGREILVRFDVGKNRGGVRWFDRVMDAMQRARYREGYGQIGTKRRGEDYVRLGISKIRGDDIKKFELPTMTGVRGWWASWRAMGGLMRTTEARYDAIGSMTGVRIFHKESGAGDTLPVNPIAINPKTNLGLLLDTGALEFEIGGKTVGWGKLNDRQRADYYKSIFFEPGHHGHHPQLRKDLNIALGVIYKLALAPSGGHDIHKYHEFNHVKEEIRTLIWERTAQDNPLAIAPYLHRMKYTSGREVRIYDWRDPSWPAGTQVDWHVLQRKLTFFNELRLSKIKGLKRPDGRVVSGHDPIPDYTLDRAMADTAAITGGSDFDIDLTPQERQLLEHIRHEGHIAAKELANVRFAFLPFMNDVLLENADYDKPGAMAMKRHYNDLGQFNSSNGALAEAADNLGTITDFHKLVEFINKFSKGIVGVHGDEFAKDKALPIIEATVAFFRRGENIMGKDEEFVGENQLSDTKRFMRWFRQQDEVHEITQKFHKANSEAQMYYNIKALALDRGQIYEAMEDLAAYGLMGHAEEEEFKKRFGGKGIFGFITRMILEGIMRGTKGALLVGSTELTKRSFKGAVQ